MTDEELVKLIRSSPWSDGFPYLRETADRMERLVEAFGILEDALQEVGDDYPGSSLQEWCQQQVRFARFALEGN